MSLTLGFNPESFNSKKITDLLDKNKALPFHIAVSTTKGWLTVDNAGVTIGDYQDSKTLKSLSWTLNFDESAPEISVLPDADSSGIKAPWPMLRLLLQPRWDGNNYVTDYPLFQGLLLDKVLLAVDVKGLTECKLQNDDQTLPHGKPFEPFGSSPAIGARLYFAHPELTLKKLEKLDIALQWMGVPRDLGVYYKNYTVTKPANTAPTNANADTTGGKPTATNENATTIDNESFKTKITLVDQRMELSLDETAMLFDTQDATKRAMLSIDNVASIIGKNYRYERQLTAINDEDVTVWSTALVFRVKRL